jgi:hypothetical protein
MRTNTARNEIPSRLPVSGRPMSAERILQNLSRYHMRPSLFKQVEAALIDQEPEREVESASEPGKRGWPKGRTRNIDNPKKDAAMQIFRTVLPKHGIGEALKQVQDKLDIGYANAYYYYSRVWKVQNPD